MNGTLLVQQPIDTIDQIRFATTNLSDHGLLYRMMVVVLVLMVLVVPYFQSFTMRRWHSQAVCGGHGVHDGQLKLILMTTGKNVISGLKHRINNLLCHMTTKSLQFESNWIEPAIMSHALRVHSVSNVNVLCLLLSTEKGVTGLSRSTDFAFSFG